MPSRPAPAARITPLGDAAALATLAAPADDAAELLPAWAGSCDAAPLAGVTDVVIGFESLAAHFDPLAVEFAAVEDWLADRIAGAEPGAGSGSRVVDVPVCYDGEDLGSVADHAGLTVEEVVRRHAAADYRVRVIGFAPGFPYLDGLPAELATPRRATPRKRVPAGAVAIGGSHAGVYPAASPGGWNLIGTTPLRLFDASRDRPSLLAPGDRVRFVPVGRDTLEESAARPAPVDEPGDPVARVVRPGALTTLQDLGRHGTQRLGVSPSGGMDARSLRLANRLVGNAEGAATIEATLVGPALDMLQPAVVAAVGAEAAGMPNGRPVAVDAGERLDVGRLTGGARCYIAIGGGWRGRVELGSASTDVRAGLGGGRLEADRRLAIAAPPPAAAVHGAWSLAATPRSATPALRVLRGPQADRFSAAGWRRFLTTAFRVSPDSDRTGVRLAGEPIPPANGPELASQPVAHGAVQVPPDGLPIVLGADRQTLGGYPVVACVASVDLPTLGQLSPGDAVRFEEVDPPTAQRLLRDAEAALRVAVEGIRLHG